MKPWERFQGTQPEPYVLNYDQPNQQQRQPKPAVNPPPAPQTEIGNEKTDFGLAPGYTIQMHPGNTPSIYSPDGEFIANFSSYDSALQWNEREYYAAARSGNQALAQDRLASTNRLRAARGMPPLEQANLQQPQTGAESTPSAAAPSGKPWERYAPQEPPKAAEQQSSSPMDYVTGAFDAFGSVVSRTVENLAPPEDPNFAGVGAVTDFGVATPYAKMVAVSDEAYSDVLKKNLGDRYLGSERDARGHEVLRYLDQNGQEKRGYVNQPGADWQDVDRFISSSLPYVAGGAIGGALTRGGGAISRVAGQALPAAGVSYGQDIAAREIGSEQGLDHTRAAMAGGLAGFAAAAGPLTAGAAAGGLLGASQGNTTAEQIAGGMLGAVGGGVAGRQVQKALTPSQQPSVVDGRLATPEAQLAARRAGLIDDANPDLDPAIAKRFGENIRKATDPGELSVLAQTERFGIETTKGQRTKAPSQLLIEKDARFGTLGDDAERLFRAPDGFDKRQQKQIERAGFSRSDDLISDQTPLDPAQRGVGETIAPGRGITNADGVRYDELGRSIADGLQRAKTAGDEAINKAWEGIGRIYPKQEAFANLGTTINQKMTNGPSFDEATMPNAKSMVDTLRRFMNGEEAKLGVGLGNPETRRMDLDFVRRRLLADKGGQTPQERSVANSIYNGFETWMDDIAERGMLAGDPANVAKIRTARQVTREVKSLFDLKDPGGKQSSGGRIMNQILEKADTPEQVIGALLGSSGPTSIPKSGSVRAINSFKEALFSKKGGMEVDPQVATRSWNDLRMAYWSRLRSKSVV